MPNRAQPAYVEIVERRPDPVDAETDTSIKGVTKVNEVRINGVPLLCPDDHGPVVHEMDLSSNDDRLVQVTFTVWARKVVIGQESNANDD